MILSRPLSNVLQHHHHRLWTLSSRSTTALFFSQRVHPLVCSNIEQSRCFQYKRSFLSDEEAVKNFIDHLGNQEKQLLLKGLTQNVNQPSNDNGGNITSTPSVGQLRLVFLHQLFPFLGFGFLDNLIMIVAGDYIDTTIGITLGISTLAAAGLGNALSDVAAIGSAWYVEKLASYIGVRYPNLSRAQMDLASTKFATTFGRAFGVFLGCILGMIPLLFMNTKKKSPVKSE